MNEEIKIIEELKKLGKISNTPNEEKFLRNLRIKLSERIVLYPIINEDSKIPLVCEIFIRKRNERNIHTPSLCHTAKNIGDTFHFLFFDDEYNSCRLAA